MLNKVEYNIIYQIIHMNTPPLSFMLVLTLNLAHAKLSLSLV